MSEESFEPAAMADVPLILAISGNARAERIAAARRLACIAELGMRRLGSELARLREHQAVDGWDSCVAEVAAELAIGHRRASGLLHQGLDLRFRIPEMGALFFRGDVTLKVATTASWRTKLILDDELLAKVDADLAKVAARFGSYSDEKLNAAIDAIVDKHDPDAVRRFKHAERELDVQFGKPDDTTGTVSIFGRVKLTDGELSDRRMEQMAKSVCPDDPRTHGERRTEAFGIIQAGGNHLPCLCGTADCPAPKGEDARGKYFEILVITNDPGAGDGGHEGGPKGEGPEGDDDGPRGDAPDDSAPDDDEPGDDEPDGGPDDGGPDDTEPVDPQPDGHDSTDNPLDEEPSADSADTADEGDADEEPDGQPDTELDEVVDTADATHSEGIAAEPDPPTPDATPCPYTSFIAGGGFAPGPLLAEMRRMGATVRAVVKPEDLTTETGYRPSTALQRFVRARDMTCRFPGCDHPAEYCDLDHTIPYGQNRLTHPGNVKALCRKHHLLKTFWVGRGGWTDEQLADGTVVWRTPAGLRRTVPPGSRILFPDWTTTTPTPTPPTNQAGEPIPGRDLRMPTRRRTRAQQHLANVKAERALNRKIAEGNSAL